MGLRDCNLYDQLRHNALTASDSAAVITSAQIVRIAPLDGVDLLAADITASLRIVHILAQNSIEYLELHGAWCAGIAPSIAALVGGAAARLIQRCRADLLALRVCPAPSSAAARGFTLIYRAHTDPAM